MIAERLVWTLAHSLWQVALVAMLAAVALRVSSRHRAEVRYAISAAAMLMAILLPLATFTFHGEVAAGLRAALRFAGLLIGPESEFSHVTGAFFSPLARTIVGWVVPAWITGVAFGAIRLASGWHATREIVRSASESASEEVTALLNSVRRQLGLACPVRLLLSADVDTPAAVGWWRPVVLLPVSALTGLDADLLRAVIAHELAHIRRHDFAINILQSCVEALLFYHPAMWWLSRRMRTEREHCCDDVAVRVCGDPTVYARALLALEGARNEAPAMAMAAARSPIKARLLRVLGKRFEGRSWGELLGLAILVLAVGVGAIWPAQTTRAAGTARPAAAVTPRSEPPAASIAEEVLTVVAGLVQDPAPRRDSGIATGRVSGQIRDSRGIPVTVGALVTATAIAEPRTATILYYSQEADDAGRYTIDLPPGRYIISVLSPQLEPGNPRAQVPQRRQGALRVDAAGSPVTVVAGRSSRIDLNIELPPIPVTTPLQLLGRVRFDDGSPLPVGTLPQFQLALTSDRARRITQPFTNMQGMVSFQRAFPGEHVVTLAPLPLGYYLKSMTYGNADLTRAPLTLNPGGGETVVDVVLTRTRPANVAPGVKVSGRITGWKPGGAPLNLMAAWDGREFNFDEPIRLPWEKYLAMRADPDLAWIEFIRVAAVTPRDDGAFEISGVPPGRYAFRSSGRTVMLDIAERDVANLELSLDSLLSTQANGPFRPSVVLNPYANRLISGIVESEAGITPEFDVLFTSTEGSPATRRTMKVSGREFSVIVPDGEYQVSVSGLPQGYALKSVAYGPLDLTSPFLVTSEGISDRFTGNAIAPEGTATLTIRLVRLP